MNRKVFVLLSIFLMFACSAHQDRISTGSLQQALTTTLVGDTTAYSSSDSTPGGQTEAWRYTAIQSGAVNTLSLCSKPGTSAKVFIGLYSSSGTKPAALLTSGTLVSPAIGWSSVSVPSVNVTAGTQYWLAILSPSGTAAYCGAGGTSQYGSRTSSATNLKTLPATYPSTGTTYLGWSAGIYASNVTSDGSGGSTGAGGATGSGGATGGASSGGAASGGTAGSGGIASGGTAGSGGASDGGTAGTAGAGGGPTGPYIRQWNEASQVGPCCQDISTTLAQPVLDGSTLLVFVTEYNINGSPAGSAPPDPITLTDSAGGSYTLLATLNSQPDWQAAMMFARYNVSAGSITASAHFVGLEWQGIAVAELANVSASPLAGSASLTSFGVSGTDSASSGAMALGSSPAFVVGFAMSIPDQYGAPIAGTGFTSVGTAWNWNGIENTSTNPSSRVEYATLSGTAAATFTPLTADDVFTFAAAFR